MQADTITGQIQILPLNPPVSEPRTYNEDFEIKWVVNARINHKSIYKYLIKWKGFTAKDNSWEPALNLDL